MDPAPYLMGVMGLAGERSVPVPEIYNDEFNTYADQNIISVYSTFEGFCFQNELY